MCSKGAGPYVIPKMVHLTVYFRSAGGVRSLECVYTRNQAALRLKWARKQDDFMGHETAAA